MKLLFIGDIYASHGRKIVAENLKSIVAEHSIDLIIANVENSAGGFGVTPLIAEDMLSQGVDCMTSGNHIWDKREIYDYFTRQPRLLRPANYPQGPGSGLYVGQTKGGIPFAVMNLQGRTYMTPTDCPFQKADALLQQIPADVKIRFVDFHAEVTSEKVAMGWHLDGRVTGMVGTHTHIPTADTRILPGGTAYQTDAGMTGPYDGVIGVQRDLILYKFKTGMPVKMDAAEGSVEMHCVVIEADESTGKATGVYRLTRSR
jgi:2',3'-cyclic-nucleotide 2'-phosphodiesterase